MMNLFGGKSLMNVPEINSIDLKYLMKESLNQH